jgi:hypothetical protein
MMVRDGLQRWRYQGRRHQSALLPQHRTAAALLGTALAALLLVLTVALWPAPKRNNNVVLPEIPRPTPTFTATAPSTDSPTASPSPSDGSSATSVPSGPPPLPTESASPPAAPPPAPTTPPARPAPAPPPPHNIRISAFEAESAANLLSGQARIRNVAEASNGQAIGHLGTGGNAPPGVLRVNGLKVPTLGVYTVTVFYIAGQERRARIRVNQTLIGTVTFPSTGDWTTIGSLTMRVNLAAGSNSVEFDNPSDWAPDIYRVILSN